MSQEAIKEIIARAMTDNEYKEILFNDPNKAFEGYELTEDEASALKGLENEFFDATEGELEERVSRAGFVVTGFQAMGSASGQEVEVHGRLPGTQTGFEDFVGDLGG